MTWPFLPLLVHPQLFQRIDFIGTGQKPLPKKLLSTLWHRRCQCQTTLGCWSRKAQEEKEEDGLGENNLKCFPVGRELGHIRTSMWAGLEDLGLNPDSVRFGKVKICDSVASLIQKKRILSSMALVKLKCILNLYIKVHYCYKRPKANLHYLPMMSTTMLCMEQLLSVSIGLHCLHQN